MNRLISLFVLIALLAGAGLALADTPGYVMRYADVNDAWIVFSYEDDLWLVPVEGGDARRITSHQGRERFAKFSPDGTKLAFSASYDGATDVYVMDVMGGVPERLTFHPSGGTVLGWTPDGASVVFSSNRYAPVYAAELYTVPIAGGAAVKLTVDRGSLASFSPDGNAMAFNRFGRHTRTWKRYEGGNAQEIWIKDFESGDIRQFTDWQGSDQFPMFGDGVVYFGSDREDGTLNLYAQDVASNTVTRLTDYTDYDVKWPSYGDGKIVFQHGASLKVYDTNAGSVMDVAINIPSDRRHLRPELITPSPRTGSFRLSPGGERALIEARGEILNYPADDGDALNLTRTSGSREQGASWSPDGRWIAFVSDRTGEEQLYLVDQRGENEWKQLTDGDFGHMNQAVWSPDSKYLIFSDKYMKLYLVDAKSGNTKEIAHSDFDDAWERWGIMDYVWSPDSKWIAYTGQTGNMNEAIWLYGVAGGKATKLTDDMTQDWSPSFSPDGKYLYFLSNRTFEPLMGRQDQNHIFLKLARPYVVLLQDGVRSPFHGDDVEVAVASDEEEEKDEKKEEPAGIDLEGIGRRILACDGVDAHNYFRLTAVDGGFLMLRKNDPEFIKYQHVGDRTGGSLDLVKYSLEDAELKDHLTGIANYHLSPDGKQLIYRARSQYGVVAAAKGGKVGDGEIDLGAVKLRIDRMEEFPNIFDEAWRIQRDWFYDAGMHGVDWQAMHDKYAPFVAGCGSRDDLNYLIGEMISELNIGHTYIFGGDFEDRGGRVGTGALGATFEADDDYYRISEIVAGVSWDPRYRSPLAEPGVNVNEGDYLIAIDGVEVTADMNPYSLLVDKGGDMVALTTNTKASADGATTTRVRTLRREMGLRYRDWVDGNLAQVTENSDGRIGYVHVPNMGENGLVEFGRSYYPQTGLQAMIIDDRYNGGGFVGDQIIDRLEREIWAMTQPREGEPGRNPERVFHGPLVVLIDGDTYSNGEFFAGAIKRLGLATVIGQRTWGGTTGIEAHQDMVDGGGTTPPQFGLYGLDGTWPIEGWGVEPDIVIINTPNDQLAGIDAQLDYAVEYLLDQLENSDGKWDVPAPPAYPNKSRPRMSKAVD